jgi:hypothetical protein
LSSAQSNATSTTTSSSSSSSAGGDGGGGGGGGSKTNVGAIVGGVVGGIAVLAIAAVIAFLLITRAHRNRRNDLANGAVAPAGGPNSGPQYAAASQAHTSMPPSHNPTSPAMSTGPPSTLGGGGLVGAGGYYAADGKPLGGNTASPGSGYQQQQERTSIFSEGTGITGSSPGTQQASLHGGQPHGVEMPGSAPPVLHEIG